MNASELNRLRELRITEALACGDQPGLNAFERVRAAKEAFTRRVLINAAQEWPDGYE